VGVEPSGLTALERMRDHPDDAGAREQGIVVLRRLAEQRSDGPVDVADLGRVLAARADAIHAADALQLLARGVELADMQIVHGPDLPIYGKLMSAAERDEYAQRLPLPLHTWTAWGCTP